MPQSKFTAILQFLRLSNNYPINCESAFFEFYNSSHKNDFSLENFIFFPENKLAHNLLKNFFSIKNFDDNPYKIIVIEGDICSGKTHLIKTFEKEHSFNFISPEQIAKQDPYDLFCYNNFFVIDDLNSLKNDETFTNYQLRP